jgi:hypothetical protein
MPEPDITANKHGGNAESAEAHASIVDNNRAVRHQIYGYALSLGAHGIIPDEVAVDFDCHHNHTSPRISELKKAGALVKNGLRRTTRSGHSAAVLVAVPGWSDDEEQA